MIIVRAARVAAEPRTSRTNASDFSLRHSSFVAPVTVLLMMMLSCVAAFGPTFPSSLRGIRASAASTTSTFSSSAPAAPEVGATSSSSSPGSDNASSIARQKVGHWEEFHGNFLLRPSVESGAPRALIHFLGGAICGAAPHMTYRYLLESLAARGYLIVATPFNLSFDHLSTCDAIISRFERIAPLLARTYGALPVVGVGHSCGALLQVLISSLFPDTPRAANALISYNNKPVNEAVPFFEELVIPFFTYAAARNDTSRNSGSEIISVGLQLAKAGAVGEIPSDDLLSRAVQLVTPTPVFEALISKDATSKTINVPDSLRQAFTTLTGPLASAAVQTGTLPIMTEALETLEQVPLLMDEVADGARDFNPTPERLKAAARRAYRARRTMILQYADDIFDESDEIEELLGAAQQIIRMKRPMVQIDVKRCTLPGGHGAPLMAPPLDVATRAETLLGVDTAKDRLKYSIAADTVEQISLWLEESNI